MVHWRELWKQECRGHVPRYRVLVPGSVPQSVVDVWKARGYKLNSNSDLALSPTAFPQRYARNLIKSKFVFASATGSGAVATGFFGSTALIATAFADTAAIATTTTLTAIAALATAGVGIFTGTRFLRDPKRLNKKELKSAPGVRWITPFDLGYIPGVTGRDTDEQRLFHLAVTIAQAIVGTRAWTHPALEGHVSRVDLDYAVASIGERLRELYELREKLEAIRQPHLEQRIDVYQRSLAKAFASLARRVESMYTYLEQLRRLSAQLVQLDSTEASQSLGEEVLDVLARTVSDDSAQKQFQELNLEAESHADAIKVMLNELDESFEEFENFDDLDRRLAQAERDRNALE